MAAGPPTVEDQGRLLEEALGVVRQQSAQMRRCLETPGKLMDALKCGCVEASSLLPALLTDGNIQGQLSFPSSEPLLLGPSNTTSYTWPSLTH